MAFEFRITQCTVFVAALLLLCGLSVAACAMGKSAEATWRYRMTVAVETPEGIKTGTAVREVHAFREPKILPEQSAGHAGVTNGEAVVVDLGKRGVLFAIISNAKWGMDYGYHIVFDAFPYKPGKYLSAEANHYYSNLSAGPVALTPDLYPTFVRFSNLQDPKTVEILSATDTKDQPYLHGRAQIKPFERVFGHGVKLQSVTVEMTKDAPTSAVQTWLPWLPEFYNKMFDGQHYNTIKSQYPIANSMAAGLFKVGDEK